MCNLCCTGSRYHKVDLASSLCLTAHQLSDYEQELLMPFFLLNVPYAASGGLLTSNAAVSAPLCSLAFRSPAFRNLSPNPRTTDYFFRAGPPCKTQKGFSLTVCITPDRLSFSCRLRLSAEGLTAQKRDFSAFDPRWLSASRPTRMTMARVTKAHTGGAFLCMHPERGASHGP
jgi:hypothetical protein